MREKKPNRRERRALEYKRMKERQLENLRVKSKPTGEPLLDLGLRTLNQASSILTSIGWTEEEICDRIENYINLERKAAEEIQSLDTSDPELHDLTIQGRALALQEQVFENDRSSKAVEKSIDFLSTEEGKRLYHIWGL